jgi:YHS domain-containing protein
MKKMLLSLGIVMYYAFSLLAHKSETYIEYGNAIRGYDPVAYFLESKPVKGTDKFVYNWKKADWYFSSEQNLNLFRDDPEKYAPQYGGYCAYGLSEGHKAPTDAEAWTIVDGKLYLNYSLDVKKKWSSNRPARIEKANANWPGLKEKE